MAGDGSGGPGVHDQGCGEAWITFGRNIDKDQTNLPFCLFSADVIDRLVKGPKANLVVLFLADVKCL